jgi:hypothetical protein
MKTAENTIVAFHVGRGGRFHNAGFKTFIGEKKISDFTDDLFIKDRENGKFCTPEYTDGGGNPVGLTVKEAETEIGIIDIDGGYNTTYTNFLSDCDENEIKLIIESREWNRDDLLDLYAEYLGYSETEIRLMNFFDDYDSGVLEVRPETKDGVRVGYNYLEEEFETCKPFWFNVYDKEDTYNDGECLTSFDTEDEARDFVNSENAGYGYEKLYYECEELEDKNVTINGVTYKKK